MRIATTIAAILICLAGLPALAAEGKASRLPDLPDPPTDPILKKALAERAAAGGAVINLTLTTNHSPIYARATGELARTIRSEGTTSRFLRELTILRTAYVVGSDYELGQHRALAKICNYPQAKIDGIAQWPQIARTVRGSTLVERGREYVMAARVIGISSFRIMLSHILPNVLGPVLVIATLNLGLAIITEATLSFLGVGLPPTEPSLGTLIRIGNDFLFSGEWWVTIFPGITLAMMVLSINLLGDWLRDALNPRLR